MNTEVHQSQAINLFTFIREFAQLNQKPVETLDSYIKTFWLDQIPHEPECSFAAWDGQDEHDNEMTIENWLSIERPERPDLPNAPETTEPWINKIQWEDSSVEYPELYSKILNPQWDIKSSEDVPKFLELQDYPHVKETWDNYIEDAWWPWAEKDRVKVHVQECYDALFSLHRTQLTMGEQYEFLLASGCLHWTTPSGRKIKRHLLTLPITIEFDSVNAIVSVKSAESTAEVQLESDMLGINEQPGIDIANDSEIRRAMLGGNLFHPDAKTLLTAWVQGLSSEGTFKDIFSEVQGTSSSKPEVWFAPALIVRRRTQRNLIAACDAIIKNLQTNGADIPQGIRKIIGELGVDTNSFSDYDDNEGNERSYVDVGDGEIYFPLDYNDDQKRILQTLNNQAGVLVQGPPGTGKSQTIANLICHLLATGKRILVTSQKAPALRVLKNKLGEYAPDVANMCVMVLGEGNDEQQELRRSVTEIVNRYSNWSDRHSQKKIQEFRTTLRKARESEAKAIENLCALRQKETENFPFGNYTGTLEQIARQIRDEESRFTWFRDRLPGDCSLLDAPLPPLPIVDEWLTKILSFLREISTDEEERCSKHLLNLDQVVDPVEFSRIVKEEKVALDAVETQREFLSDQWQKGVDQADDKILISMLGELDEYLGCLRSFLNNGTSWLKLAAQDVLSGNAARWQALHHRSQDLLNEIREKTTVSEISKFQVLKFGPNEQSCRMRVTFGLILLSKVALDSGFYALPVSNRHYIC
jgi:hypothetical protein